MSRLFFIFTIFALPNSALAQDTDDATRCYKLLKDSTENFIGYGCGNPGRTSENLYYIRYLIVDRRFDLIVKLLDSKTASTRYIAALTLIQAEKKSLYRPDSVTRLLIDTLKQDNTLIPFCFGCTLHYQTAIKLLLENKKNEMGIKYFITDCFRKRPKYD